jgi:hypothetical protein
MKELESLIVLAIIPPPILLQEELGVRSRHIPFSSRRHEAGEAEVGYQLRLITRRPMLNVKT